jgi:hypothetical protein
MIRSIGLFAAICATLLVTASSCITRVQPAPAPNSMVSNERVKVIGNYTATLGCGLFEADKAVRAAAKGKNLVQLSRINEQDSVCYEYKDIYDNRISVDLKLDVNKQTGITIKFGKTGNKEFSKAFLDAIGFELNRATTAE